MKRFLPMMLALSFSAIAVALMLFVFRPRIQSIRVSKGGLREKLEEVVEEVVEEVIGEITEPKGGAR